MGNSFSLGSKANYLLKDTFPFLVYCTTGLKHNRSEVVVRLLERGGVTISLLGLGVRLTWFRRVKMRGGERANDGNVDGEATVETPVLDRHVSGPTTRLVSRTQDTQLLQLGGEEAGISELEHEISNVVVPRDSVAGLLAAANDRQTNPCFARKEGTGQKKRTRVDR